MNNFQIIKLSSELYQKLSGLHIDRIGILKITDNISESIAVEINFITMDYGITSFVINGKPELSTVELFVLNETILIFPEFGLIKPPDQYVISSRHIFLNDNPVRIIKS